MERLLRNVVVCIATPGRVAMTIATDEITVGTVVTSGTKTTPTITTEQVSNGYDYELSKSTNRESSLSTKRFNNSSP